MKISTNMKVLPAIQYYLGPLTFKSVHNYALVDRKYEYQLKVA